MSQNLTQNINLVNLATSEGYSIYGAYANGRSGYSVHGAGDVNGDGYSDIIIGAPYVTSNQGITYVVFGQASNSNLNLDTFVSGATYQGFSIEGPASGDYSGYSVSGAGDVNGDGYSDIIIGAPYESSSAGISYVIYGKDNNDNINLANLISSQGFSITGANQGDLSGYSVSGIGDINGDGYDDIIIGAPNTNNPSTSYYFYSYHVGIAYVILGNSINSNINLADLSIYEGFSIQGTNAANSACGHSVSGAGDVNGDGYKDVIISNGYSSYIIFGGVTVSNIDLSSLSLAQGIAITGSSFGISGVSGIGNINGDEYDDVIIGASTYGSNNNGIVYIIYGKSAVDTVNINLADLSSSQGFYIISSNQQYRFGNALSGTGDINNDGYDDFIVGAYAANNNQGISYIIFGNNNNINLDLDDFTLYQGITITGILSNDYSGYSVSGAGDINNDNYTDVIIGAYGTNDNTGTSYIIYGGYSLVNEPTTIPTFSPTPRPSIYPTFIPSKTPTFLPTTTTYVPTITSSTTTFAPSKIPTFLPTELTHTPTIASMPTVKPNSKITFFPTLAPTSSLNVANIYSYQGYSIVGSSTDSQSGWSVSNAGDVNGDGYSDVITCAINGNAYIIYGSAVIPSTINLENIGKEGIHIYSGLSGASCSVSSAGDINNDGYDDVVIAIGGNYAYVIYGNLSIASSIDVSTLGNQGISITINGLGFSPVSGAGDVNNDGYDDIILGNSVVNDNSGESYILFGNAYFPNEINLANSSSQVKTCLITGANAGDSSGASVSGAGDINNDGYDDIIIGAPQANQAYVIYGSSNLPPSISLSNIGTYGFYINGGTTNTEFGYSVSGTGDINNDGYNDLIIIAPTGIGAYIIYGNSSLPHMINVTTSNDYGLSVTGGYGSYLSASGAGDINNDGYSDFIIGTIWDSAYVIYGNVYLPSTINLIGLSGNEGFAIVGSASSSCGWSVSEAGDVNNDGYDDVIIGAPGGTNSYAGESYVIYGAASGYTTLSPIYNPTPYPTPTLMPTEPFNPLPNINLASLTSSQGFSILGENYGDKSGTSVRWAGDINGDGYVDIIIGAPGAASGTGTTYIIYGSKSFSSTIDLTSLGSQGVTILGENIGDYSGTSVSGAGDVNGDGYADIIIGAPNANSNNGEVYVVYGGISLPSTINLSNLGIQGFSIIGAYSNGYSSYTGTSVGIAGDINGDGYSDIIIGAPVYGLCCVTTSSYVIYGGPSLVSTINLANLGAQGFIITEENGDNIGYSVSGIGDVNNDGYDEVIVSCPGSSTSYVIYGGPLISSTINVASLGIQGFSLTHGSTSSNSASLSSAGDFNNDGYNDILIGSTGNAWIIFGSNSLPSTINLLDIEQPYGITFYGDCTSVSGIGDINRDGYDDIMIGATDANYPYGAAYIIYGRASLPSTIYLANLIPALGFNISTTDLSQEGIGYSVSGVGDINGDGYTDIILGIPNENTQTGASYIVFGSEVTSDDIAENSSNSNKEEVGLISGLVVGGVVIVGALAYTFYTFTHNIWPFAASVAIDAAINIELQAADTVVNTITTVVNNPIIGEIVDAGVENIV